MEYKSEDILKIEPATPWLSKLAFDHTTKADTWINLVLNDIYLQKIFNVE